MAAEEDEDLDGWGNFEEIDFAAAGVEPAEAEPRQVEDSGAKQVEERTELANEPANLRQAALSWRSSLLDFGREFIAEATHVFGEEAGKQAAEEMRQQEADAKTNNEAEKASKEAAQKEAEERARKEAEAQAQKEAEEKARKEAEVQAQKEAEEKARMEAEEEARREAEAQAQKEAEEIACKEAEAQAQKEAEEKARMEAEEEARKEAEAQKEAEERARKEAEAQAQKEAEEIARQEAEAQAQKDAEEKARMEAEEEARREAEAQAQKEAEERARKEAEAQAQKEAEEIARKEAEEKARMEAEARREADAQAQKKAQEMEKPREEDLFVELETPAVEQTDVGSIDASVKNDDEERECPDPDCAAGSKKAEVLAMLQKYQGLLKNVYNHHNPEKALDIDKLIQKYTEQLEQLEDLEAFERHCEVKLASLYQAVCKKYGIEAADESPGAEPAPHAPSPTLRDELVAIYERNNPSKLSSVDELLSKFQGREGILYRSICEKYGEEVNQELLKMYAGQEEPSQKKDDKEDGPGWGLFGGLGALTSTSALQSLRGAAEGLQGLREKVERSFDEALADRGEESVDAVHLSGLQTRETLHGVPEEGTGEQMENPFAEVVHSEEAAEKDAAKAHSAATEAPLLPSPDATTAEEGAAEPGEVTDSVPQAPIAAKPMVPSTAHASPEQKDAWQAERERLLRENRGLKMEKENLIMEGTKMSHRVQAVEERMKAMAADARRSESQMADAERTQQGLQGQLSRAAARAEKAEAQSSELRAETRRLTAELDRARQQIQGEKRQMQADQQALQMKSRENSEKERRMEERVQQLMHERDELRATSASLTVELQQAMGTVDSLERRLQQQMQDMEHLQERHRRQIEAAEYEFVNESMPYQQRLGELEAQLAHQEQKFLEREAVAYRERDKERAELEVAKEDLRQREQLQERRAREMREESGRAQQAIADAAAARREVEEVLTAKEAADRARESAEGELKLEMARRRSAELRAGDLQQQVDKLQTAPRPAVVPGGSLVASVKDSELQHLRGQVDAITKHRDTLQQETARLQQQLEQQHAGVAAQTALAQRFEVALQAIGKLQEELEACQHQRDGYKQQCERLQAPKDPAPQLQPPS